MHTKAIFHQMNKYSNNPSHDNTLITNRSNCDPFCTDSCFVLFECGNICNLWNVFSRTIMSEYPRDWAKRKFLLNKTILGAVVYRLHQFPINPKRLKHHWFFTVISIYKHPWAHSGTFNEKIRSMKHLSAPNHVPMQFYLHGIDSFMQIKGWKLRNWKVFST